MNRLRKSVWISVLYWLISTEDHEIRESLSDEHRLWIKDVLAAVSLDTLPYILKRAEDIERNPRIRGSFSEIIRKELRTYRTPKTVRIPEPRRIGVGYRDKGSLRPHHMRGRDHGEPVYWSEDLGTFFPSTLEPGYITAEEVCSLGIDLEHLRIWKQTLQYNREVPTLHFSSQ